MPNRIVREGILTSGRMATLDWPSEVFFRRLMSVVDDFGRYYADPGLLRAACYPRQLNKVTDADIGKWMQCAAEAGLVSVYRAEDREMYLEIANFGQQVRAKKSKFPGPPINRSTPASTCVADAEHLPEDAHLDVSVSVSVSEGENAPAAQPPPTARRRRQLDVEVLPEKWRSYCVERLPAVEPEALFERFRDHHTAHGKTMADWSAAWRTWVGNEIKFGGPRLRATGSAEPKPWDGAI